MYVCMYARNIFQMTITITNISFYAGIDIHQ